MPQKNGVRSFIITLIEIDALFGIESVQGQKDAAPNTIGAEGRVWSLPTDGSAC
jgi:hypothetical protein